MSEGIQELSGLDSIRKLIERSPVLRSSVIQFEKDNVILQEGQINDSIYILIEGEIALYKSDETGRFIKVDQFGPGSFLGLTSFWSKTRSFAESRALTPVKCLKLDRETFNDYMQRDDELSRSLYFLFIGNLSERYRRMVSLNLKIAFLSQTLEDERNQLKAAIENLNFTRNRLIHQEKLATLGQLVAGIAHEINNPCAALLRGIEQLGATIQSLFSEKGPLHEKGNEAALVQAGLTSDYLSNEEKRVRMAKIESAWPDIPRSLIRRLASLPEEFLESLLSRKRPGNTKAFLDQLEQYLNFYETGALIRTIQLSGERIGELVVSLKNYGRQDSGQWERVDLEKGLQDTLRILNNRLRNYTLHFDWNEVPPVLAYGGELNQVWTNILVNACDALGDRGDIWVSLRYEPPMAVVEIADNGPGILPEHLDRIFETNFTTKNTSKAFGLGLGLAISQQIVAKHGGTIRAENRPEGGARFIVMLPVEEAPSDA